MHDLTCLRWTLNDSDPPPSCWIPLEQCQYIYIPVYELIYINSVTGSMESTAEQIAVHQPSMRDNKTR